MTAKLNWKQRAIVFTSSNSFLPAAYGIIKKIPFFGTILQRIAKFIIPNDSRIWLQIPTGLGAGLWIYLNPRFEMDYARGAYEPLIEKAIASGLRPGCVFYDVGAHIGLYSLIAARIVGKSGAVFAFESDAENADRIKEHARRNGFQQIHVVSCAVWSCHGKLRFQRAAIDSSRNQGAVITDGNMYNGETVEVEAISLDKFSGDHLNPTMIKIDIEGAEAAALKGCDTIFSIQRPVLICEIHNQAAEEEVTKWLESKLYQITFLEETRAFPRHLLARYDVGSTLL